MNNIIIEKYPLITKYFYTNQETREMIKYHLERDNLAFFNYWEPRLGLLKDCSGFEDKIKEINRNSDKFYDFLSEFKEAFFLKSKGFQIEFSKKEGPDFLAKSKTNVLCCEVKTINVLTIETIWGEIEKLDLNVSITLYYSIDTYFDNYLKKEFIKKVISIYQKYLKEPRELLDYSLIVIKICSIEAILDFKKEGNVSGISTPEDLEKSYDNVWKSISDHLTSALENLSHCGDSFHKIVILDIPQTEFAIYLNDILYGEEGFKWIKNGEKYVLEKVRKSNGIFTLTGYKEIEVLIIYSNICGKERLVFPNLVFYPKDILDIYKS